MIAGLPQREQEWLARFFSDPNGLDWASLVGGSASAREAGHVRQWLGLLGPTHSVVPLVLPFARGDKVAGWYATTQGPSGAYELGDEIRAWLGPTWLSRIERMPEGSADPMAKVLHDRFRGTVYRFTGPDDAARRAISARLGDLAAVLGRRPPVLRTHARPVGAISGAFERALLAGDEVEAQAAIVELRQTGRLNEENLRYLEVRLRAGLGLWPQIARDHWLVRTMADLALPPQVLADLIEALYRTYVDEAEESGDPTAIRDAFARDVAISYPKLFASRRGIRAPRVVKAFLLFEGLQPNPSALIVNGLLELLPVGTDAPLFFPPQMPGPASTADVGATTEEADEAFDNGQMDRAFEFYLRLAPSTKTIVRLVSCAVTIGTGEARDRLLGAVDAADMGLVAGLAPEVASRIEGLRKARSLEAGTADGAAGTRADGWLAWAERLKSGRGLDVAVREVRSATTNWDAGALRNDARTAQRFADIIGGLNGEAGEVARASVPQIFEVIFAADSIPPPAAKPIASLLFLLIAMDATLSRADLDLLAQLAGLLVEQGLSSEEYVSLINDLEDVQRRIASYSYLPWSLDLGETLAILPCPSHAGRDARLRLFVRLLGEASGFAHRLAPHDLLSIVTLARDYGVGPEAVEALVRDAKADEQASDLPSLDGRTVGIYTLSETAGARARAALERLFPGCKVGLNSDLVATPQLSSLAKAADVFVFAWRSSSHQAFHCVQKAMSKGEPIYAPGKGTASILRAVLDHLGR